MSVRTIQLRRDYKDQWELVNPALRQGELGVELGSGRAKVKCGDGFTSWNDLPYLGDDGLQQIRTECGDEVSCEIGPKNAYTQHVNFLYIIIVPQS